MTTETTIPTEAVRGARDRILDAYEERYGPLNTTVACSIVPPKLDPARVLELLAMSYGPGPEHERSLAVAQLMNGSGYRIITGSVVVVEPPPTWGTTFRGLEAVLHPGGVARWPDTKTRPPLYCVFYPDDVVYGPGPEKDSLTMTELQLGYFADLNNDNPYDPRDYVHILSGEHKTTTAYMAALITLGRLTHNQGAIGLVVPSGRWIIQL